jgi:hypothetical protein
VTDRNRALDTNRPQCARLWNYWLGGKDNFAADRALADQITAFYPEIVTIARESRRFLVRAVTYLAGEAGISQFLDVGTDLPTVDNTHEVAQRIRPHARVVYVDNDPMVAVHARALLTSHAFGVTDYVDADIRDPDTVLRAAASILDLTQPVGLMMLGVLGDVTDYDEARLIVRRLVAGLAPGSYLVVNDGTNVIDPEPRNRATQVSIDAGTPYIARHPDQIAGYFDGLHLVEPGVVSTTRWRPDPGEREPAEVDAYCGVARVP